MSWLVWRQHRVQLLFGLVALGVLLTFFLLTGLRMHREYNAAGLGDCLPALIDEPMTNAAVGISIPDGPPLGESAEGRCALAANDFYGRNQMVVLAGLLLGFLPLLAGMFWGAPVVARELERGTHRLVWTQGISRLRWGVVKIALVTAGVLALTALYAVMFAWWVMPVIATSGQRFDYVFFDQHGVVVFGYTTFALALGICAGTITRRTPSAMAVTLVGFLTLRLLMTFVVRPRMLPTQSRPSIVDGLVANPLHGDWLIERVGVEGCIVGASCPESGLELFHPASQFWAMQAIETGVFVALAAVLIAVALRRIGSRLA